MSKLYWMVVSDVFSLTENLFGELTLEELEDLIDEHVKDGATVLIGLEDEE